MIERPYFNHVIVVPRLRVQNANAISSPLTHGFPAISAFTGLMWALERSMHSEGADIQFHAVGVVAHDYEELTTDDRYARAFRLTRNPVGKDGKTAAIVEEGRMHMTVSLIFAVQSQSLDDEQQALAIANQIKRKIETMRVAGGSVLPSPSFRKFQPFALPITRDGEEAPDCFAKLGYRLLPGFALVERSDLLEERSEQMQATDPSSTKIDAWLSLSRVNWRWYEDSEDLDKGRWQHDRKGLGWIVPIPVGLGALGDVQSAGSIVNARDQDTDFCFVESLYSIGQWVSPHRLNNVLQLLWFANYLPETGVYRYSNDYGLNLSAEFVDPEFIDD